MKKHKEVSSNIQVEPIDLSTKLSNQYIPSFGGLLDLVSSNPSLEDSLQLNNNNIGDITKDTSNKRVYNKKNPRTKKKIEGGRRGGVRE